MEKIKKKLNSKSVAGYVFTAPLIFGFLFFLLVPMIISMYYSFCDYNILSPAKFSGLANYKKMITDDTFWLSLKVTFYFCFCFCSVETDICSFCSNAAVKEQ